MHDVDDPYVIRAGAWYFVLPADWYLTAFSLLTILTEILRFAQDDGGRREGIMDNLGRGKAP